MYEGNVSVNVPTSNPHYCIMIFLCRNSLIDIQLLADKRRVAERLILTPLLLKKRVFHTGSVELYALRQQVGSGPSLACPLKKKDIFAFQCISILCLIRRETFSPFRANFFSNLICYSIATIASAQIHSCNWPCFMTL